jgi:hypothetical protein
MTSLIRLPENLQGTNLTPFECWRGQGVLSAHFNTQYDVFKYQGKAKNFNHEAFERSRASVLYHRLAKKKDPIGMVVANLVENPNFWVLDILSQEGESVYLAWKGRLEGITYHLQEQLKKIGDVDDALTVSEDGDHPKLLSLYNAHEVSAETVLHLDKKLNFFPYWDAEIKVPILWARARQHLAKYRPFIETIIPA